VETKWTGLPVHFFRQLTYTRRHEERFPCPPAAAAVRGDGKYAVQMHRRVRRDAVHQPENREEKLHGAVLSATTAPPAAAGCQAARKRDADPADFPRVSGSEQKSRDGDRRAILDKELANESQNLEKAKKTLFDAGNQPPDKLQPLRDTVALHERNIEALKKELGNLR
jgi:hypothetical protein